MQEEVWPWARKLSETKVIPTELCVKAVCQQLGERLLYEGASSCCVQYSLVRDSWLQSLRCMIFSQCCCKQCYKTGNKSTLYDLNRSRCVFIGSWMRDIWICATVFQFFDANKYAVSVRKSFLNADAVSHYFPPLSFSQRRLIRLALWIIKYSLLLCSSGPSVY